MQRFTGGMVEPRRVAQYQLLEQIGRGALGTVYRARDTVVNRLVAVKLIPLAGCEETRKSAYACLYREARTAGHLSHSGIVKLYTVGHEQGFAYIVMELVNGPTLGHWLSAKQQVDRTSALRLAGQIALALDHIHRHGFVHRDIKPSNIMIHDDGNVKITDFGIARLEISRKLTRTGFIVGTPPYMSPEQLQDEPLDGRSDQYSFGVVVYRMIAGRLPFLAATAPELCHKIVHEPPPPPGTFNPACGSALDAAILRALAKDPAGRYATCADFVQAIEAAWPELDWLRLDSEAGLQDTQTIAAAASAAPLSPPARSSPPRRHTTFARKQSADLDLSRGAVFTRGMLAASLGVQPGAAGSAHRHNWPLLLALALAGACLLAALAGLFIARH